MGFWLKKFISHLLLPLPFGLFLITLGIFALLVRCRKISISMIFIGFLVIALFSLHPISSTLINTLQNQYSPLTTPPSNVSEVVVLGGGVSGNKNFPPNITLSASSLSRLVEGIRLLKLIQQNHPHAQLILSGGRVFQSPAIAGKMQNTALMLGIAAQNMTLENGSRDTREEAVFLQKIVGNKPFILVTSAFHMPRSIWLFKQLGMNPIAAPTQFLGKNNNPVFWYIPKTTNLINSDLAIHEYLGMAWTKIASKIRHG
jgi:uncharacterized SAM-binding protein YcdF (DUF218 family)